jgi:hypothetical protein
MHIAAQYRAYHVVAVTNVTGLVTAKGPNGFWLRNKQPDNDERTSERCAFVVAGDLPGY